MALKTIRIGSADQIFQYDDADFDSAVETDGPIKAGTPVDPIDVVRLQDIVGPIVGPSVYPVGSIYLSVVSTNPNTLFGFGTWVRIAEGQLLVGFKTGDPNFAPVENSGGSLTSGTPSSIEAVDNNLDISTVNVAKNDHTHSILPPFFVIYVWKRTA